MKKIILSAIMAAGVLAGFAQQKDPKAKEILDLVSNKFKTYSSVKANFVYQLQNKDGKVLSSKNGVIDMKGQKYNITFGGNKIISDGQTVWNYDPGAKEVTINNANNAANTITPQKLFTNFYDRDFMYMLTGEKKWNGKPVQEVLLQPIDSKKSFSRAYLWIDKAAKSIVSAYIVEKSGNRIVYTINSLKPNAAVAESQFAFDKAKFPGVEVVDLR